MKQIKFEVQDSNEIVISEETLTVEESEKLIIQLPEGLRRDTMKSIYEHVKTVLEDPELNVMVFPESVKITVLKV